MIRNFIKILFLMIVTLLTTHEGSATDPLKLTLNKGRFAKILVAIHPFESMAEPGIEANIRKVIEADLNNCGFFYSVDRPAFPETLKGFGAQPRPDLWKKLNISAVLNCRVYNKNFGTLGIDCKLYDLVTGRHLSFPFTFRPEQWRRVAHMIADSIYCRLMGYPKGYFDSKIFYVSRSGKYSDPNFRLAMMDYDGANHRFVTDGMNMISMPAMPNSGKEIAFVEVISDKKKNKQHKIYRMDLLTHRKSLVGNTSLSTYAPAYSPDGKFLVYSASKDGNSSIYLMNLETGQARRLTNTPGVIDTSPSFSADQRKIFFESDRNGKQQIFSMNVDGSDIQNISYGNGKYCNPVCSPVSEWIAFVKQQGSEFSLCVMRPDGSGERAVALGNGNVLDTPTWSPNGQVIIYTRQSLGDKKGRGRYSRLCSQDVTGRQENLYPTPTDALDAAWVG